MKKVARDCAFLDRVLAFSTDEDAVVLVVAEQVCEVEVGVQYVRGTGR
jgi:hypothetical protein